MTSRPRYTGLGAGISAPRTAQASRAKGPAGQNKPNPVHAQASGSAGVARGPRSRNGARSPSCSVTHTGDGEGYAVLDLPYTEPPLSLNDRGASRDAAVSKNKVVQQLRSDVVFIARQAKLPRGAGYAVVQLHYRPQRRRGRDADNLSATAKPIYDALTVERAPHFNGKSIVAGRTGYGLVEDDQPHYMGTLQPRLHDPAPDPDNPGSTLPGRLWIVVEWYPARPAGGPDPLAQELLAIAQAALGADRTVVASLLADRAPRYAMRWPELAVALTDLIPGTPALPTPKE